MGILVWQVFPIHFAVRDDDVVIEKAATMMKEMVRMLYNHASIVIWSVAKEPQIYPLRATHRNNNYGRLCEIMYEAGKTVDPIRWMHKGDYGEGVQNFTPGYCLPGDTDVRKHPLKPQIVEFHTSALPCMETMKQIMAEEDLWPPNWDRWSWLGFQYNIWINNQKIEIGRSLEEFIENSQSYAYRANKEIIEFLRQRKYAPVASMFYHYWNDPFPQIGCGLLDYFRRPYRHYDSLALCYTPVLVSLEWCRDTHVLGFEKVYRPDETFVAKIWSTNDRGEVLPDCSVGWKVQDEAGKVIAEKELVVSIPADASRVIDVLSVPLLDQRGRLLTVRMTLRDGGGATLSTNAFPFRVST
jgi:beta-mannosidase